MRGTRRGMSDREVHRRALPSVKCGDHLSLRRAAGVLRSARFSWFVAEGTRADVMRVRAIVLGARGRTES